MADESSNNPGPFDVPTIRALIGMMSKHDINEVDLRQGDQRIRLQRGMSHHTPLMQAAPPSIPQAMPAPAAPANEAPADKPDKSSKTLYEIKSPTPGTFYAASSPDAEHYVKKGSKVNPDTVVCLIEAMKVFNEIQAEVSGVIAEILVQNADPVEYGTVLFRVDTSG